MPSKRRLSPLDEQSRVLLPGLEYARSLIDTAILICRAVAKTPPDDESARQPPPEQSS